MNRKRTKDRTLGIRAEILHCILTVCITLDTLDLGYRACTMLW